MTSSDGSTEFQQMMLNYLGDRDYDSFEYKELPLLESKIRFALFGSAPQGCEDKQKTQIKFLFNTILTENNRISKWKDRVLISFIYNCTEPLPEEKERRAKKYTDYRPEYDLNPIPIFVLRKCKLSPNPCRVFIDNTGRVYQTWKEYLTENKLPECNMVVPQNGRYMEGPNGEVLLERHPSPACNPSPKILQEADIREIANRGISVVAATVLLAPATTPAVLAGTAVAGICVGAYCIGRNIYNLVDRSTNKQDLSFSNSEARGAYLNILAGTLGLVGDGTSMAMSQMAAQGVNIDTRQQTPSESTAIQLMWSIFFFGHAVYDYQTVDTLSRELQVRDIHESLQNNRQRRTLNKLLKETIRQNDGNVQHGQVQVIKAIRIIRVNQDKVIATLARWNMTFNKNKVRFAVQDGNVTLNGVVVHINEFGNMDWKQGLTYLRKLPGIPKLTQTYNMIKDAFKGIELEGIENFSIGILNILGNADMTINQKIINAVASIINTLLGDRLNNYMGVLDDIFPHNTKYFKMVGFVSGYFQKMVDEVEKKYQQWYDTKDSTFEELYFITLLSLDSVERATEIFNLVTKAYYTETNLTEYGLNLLLSYFYDWFAEQCCRYQDNQQRREERMRYNNSQRAPQVRCPTCNGLFYDREALHRN